MHKFIITAFLGFGIIPKVNAQQFAFGRVLSGHDSISVFNAHVYVKGTSYGTTTNQEGDFKLNLRTEQLTDTLVISYVGFDLLEVPASLCHEHAVFYINHSESFLDEVEITAVDARGILEEVRKNMSSNYPNSFDVYDIHYKEVIKNDDQFSRYLELAVEIATIGFSNQITSLKDYKKLLIKGKRISESSQNRAFDKSFGIHGIYTAFGIRDLRLDLSDEYFPSYIFEYEGMTTYEGHDVYIISIRVPDFPNKNIIYVTMDTKAIVMSHYEEDWNIFKNLKGKSEPTLNKYIAHSEFHKSGDKWYLKYIRDYRKKVYQGDSTQSVDRMIRVLDVREKSKIQGGEKMNKLVDLYNHPCPYDPEFWNNYNAPIETGAEKKIKAQLEANNIQLSKPEP